MIMNQPGPMNFTHQPSWNILSKRAPRYTINVGSTENRRNDYALQTSLSKAYQELIDLKIMYNQLAGTNLVTQRTSNGHGRGGQLPICYQSRLLFFSTVDWIFFQELRLRNPPEREPNT